MLGSVFLTSVCLYWVLFTLSLALRLTCSEARLLLFMVYPSRQLPFLLRRKQHRCCGLFCLPGGQSLWLGKHGGSERSPCVHSWSTDRKCSGTHRSFSFVQSGTLVCWMEWLSFFSCLFSMSLETYSLRKVCLLGVWNGEPSLWYICVSWVAGTANRHCETVCRL